MSIRKTWRIPFSLTLVIFLSLWANLTSAEEVITLERAIEIAMENNHEIRALKNSLLAEKENVGIARSYLLPKITFEERFMRTNNPTYGFMAKLNQERFAMEDFAIPSLNNPKAINDFQSSLSFEQPIFVRKANLGLDMSKTELKAKEEELTRKKEEVALMVAKAYLMILTSKEYVKVSERSLNDAKEHLRIAELREKAGLGLHSDVLRASTAVVEAEQRLVSAKKNLAVAERSLGLLLGSSEPVHVADEFIDLPLNGLDYYINAASSRKDLETLRLRYENAKTNVKVAESGYLPMIGIGGSYQLNDHKRPFGSEGSSYNIVAFLRWEIFDGTKREHEIAKAKAQASQVAEHLEGLKKAIIFKIHESYMSVEEARKNLELTSSALKSAEEGRRLVRIRYENGLSPMVDLLDAQLNVDHSRANYVAMQNNYRMAVMNLLFESGTILKDLRKGGEDVYQK